MISYLITDPLFYGSTPESLKNKLTEILHKYRVDYVCFRDKSTTIYEKIAEAFIATSKEAKIENIFLHSNVELASKLKADGIHLTSTQFDQIAKAKKLKLKVIISTHSKEEIEKAINLGADAVTYSPIFASKNKGEPKGIEDLQTTVNSSEIDIFALGSIITATQIKQVESSGAYGFASIRYFL
ncbi:MAG: thiamine phosphate synthase [Helicobacteraceae bacterium]|nr:thiamine phosphate synthase [Helicobacteraceae bacterium]